METMTPETPVISYRQIEPAQETDTSTPKEATKIDQLLTAVTWVILVIVLTVWALVGALFWIPLIIRAMLRFSISLVEAAFEGQKPVESARILRDAVGFYRRGFVVAIEVVSGKETTGLSDAAATTENRLLKEVLWALLVWYFIALGLGWIQASPLDLWDWLSSIPWGEHISDLIQKFRV
jgi:hypothetical protein